MPTAASSVLVKKGCRDDIAEISARLIAETSCDGVYSHGVNRFPRVVEYIDKGYIQVTHQVDGIGGLNAGTAIWAGNVTPRRRGGAWPALNTNHWPRRHLRLAGRRRGIGTAGPHHQHAAGGATAASATIRSSGAPQAATSVDMAMAQFSYGQMEAAKMRGGGPGGYDEAGNISTDPGEIRAGGLRSASGGSGMSILLDLVATCSGALTSRRQAGRRQYSCRRAAMTPGSPASLASAVNRCWPTRRRADRARSTIRAKRS
ncbi:MAG: Ldh family oxidoreductase [Betaproteobacteria bacterium]|nr:Ldh family oxidoreductase [Betaproteobacteria bacterium]